MGMGGYNEYLDFRIRVPSGVPRGVLKCRRRAAVVVKGRLEKALARASYLDAPAPLPMQVSDREVPERLAYCPVIARRCALVDCGACKALEEDLGEIARAWACSSCSRNLGSWSRRPYWKDGECSFCGERSIVLTLLVQD